MVQDKLYQVKASISSLSFALLTPKRMIQSSCECKEIDHTSQLHQLPTHISPKDILRQVSDIFIRVQRFSNKLKAGSPAVHNMSVHPDYCPPLPKSLLPSILFQCCANCHVELAADHNNVFNCTQFQCFVQPEHRRKVLWKFRSAIIKLSDCKRSQPDISNGSTSSNNTQIKLEDDTSSQTKLDHHHACRDVADEDSDHDPLPPPHRSIFSAWTPPYTQLDPSKIAGSSSDSTNEGRQGQDTFSIYAIASSPALSDFFGSHIPSSLVPQVQEREISDSEHSFSSVSSESWEYFCQPEQHILDIWRARRQLYQQLFQLYQNHPYVAKEDKLLFDKSPNLDDDHGLLHTSTESMSLSTFYARLFNPREELHNQREISSSSSSGTSDQVKNSRTGGASGTNDRFPSLVGLVVHQEVDDHGLCLQRNIAIESISELPLQLSAD